MYYLMEISCPTCGSSEVAKYGKTKAGLQKFRCLSDYCRRQFVAGSEWLIKPEIKPLVRRLIELGIPPWKIFEAVKDPETEEAMISLQSIYKLRRKAKNDRQEKD
jgi:transposase-like protein